MLWVYLDIRVSGTLWSTLLVDFTDEEFVSKAAWTLEEASWLVESGFVYVCDIENAKLFQKTK